MPRTKRSCLLCSTMEHISQHFSPEDPFSQADLFPPPSGPCTLPGARGAPSRGEALSPTGGAAICKPEPQEHTLDGQPSLFSDNYRRDLKPRCSGRMHVYGHPAYDDVPAHRWNVPQHACMKSNCDNAVCVSRHTRERGKRVEDLYMSLAATATEGPLGFQGVVLTIPGYLKTMDQDKLKRLRRGARKAVSQWVSEVNGIVLEERSREGWRLAGVDCWHPEGDENPGVWNPHIHLQVLNLAYWSGGVSPSDRWLRLRLKVTTDQLRRLRMLWGAVLWGVLGWEPRDFSMEGPPDFSPCNVNVEWRSMGWRSRKAFAQWRHRIRYDFRHWPQYKGTWRQIQWWGYMSPAAKGKLGLVEKEEDLFDSGEYEEVPFNICPRCGVRAKEDVCLGHRASATPRDLYQLAAPGWLIRAEHVSADKVLSRMVETFE